MVLNDECRLVRRRRGRPRSGVRQLTLGHDGRDPTLVGLQRSEHRDRAQTGQVSDAGVVSTYEIARQRSSIGGESCRDRSDTLPPGSDGLPRGRVSRDPRIEPVEGIPHGRQEPVSQTEDRIAGDVVTTGRPILSVQRPPVRGTRRWIGPVRPCHVRVLARLCRRSPDHGRQAEAPAPGPLDRIEVRIRELRRRLRNRQPWQPALPHTVGGQDRDSIRSATIKAGVTVDPERGFDRRGSVAGARQYGGRQTDATHEAEEDRTEGGPHGSQSSGVYSIPPRHRPPWRNELWPTAR